MPKPIRILIEGEDLEQIRVDAGGKEPKDLEVIFLALLAGLQRELLVARLGLPAFNSRIIAPPRDGGR